jgi:hypothetical protein
VKRLGSYSSPPRIERRPAAVVVYQGNRAHIRFHDGQTYAMPSEPLKKIGVSEGDTFFVVTTWAGKVPLESRVELLAEPRARLEKRATPKVMVRDGAKLSTRKPAPAPLPDPKPRR